MNQKFNERIQKFYEEQYKNREYKGSRLYRLLRRFVKNREEMALGVLSGGEKLLDVGCGEGWLVRKAALKYKIAIGIDIATNRLKRAKSEAKKEKVNNVQFLQANIDQQDLPFKNGEFDALICLSVLEYLFDPYFTMKEFKRVLKKGGTLIIEVPNIAYFPERLRLLFGKLPGVAHAKGWAGGRLHHFTLETLEKLINDNGFTVIKKTGCGFLRQLRDLRLPLLSPDLFIVGRKLK